MIPASTAVFKFGGTSVGGGERIRRVARIVASQSIPVVVVVSAPAGVTNLLDAAVTARIIDDRELAEARMEEAEGIVSAIAREIGPELVDAVRTRFAEAGALLAPDPGSGPALPVAALRDAVVSTGEDVSSLLVTEALQAAGSDAVRIDPRDVIRTDDRFGAARPDVEAIRSAATAELAGVLTTGSIAVVGGFVGSAPDGRTTTLGRGGSDFTATLLGAAIDAAAVHIWTDVDGILSGDPRMVDHPRSLEVVGFEEAVELAWFGAKVLHAGAAKHAVSHGIPVRIRSTFTPERPGTLILAERWAGPDIAAVACRTSVALMQVRSRPSAIEYGFLAGVFAILARHRTPVDLVATSHTSTAFTIDADAELGALAAELEELAEVEFTEGLATVTVVGRGLLREPGFAARVFRTVAFTPVRLISQATDASLSFLVDEAEVETIVRRLHRILIEGRAADGTQIPAAS